MIDNGASDHMCNVLALFDPHTLKEIDNVDIRIPNCKKVHVSWIGIVHLSNTIVLQDVLYVLDFKFNITSIHSPVKIPYVVSSLILMLEVLELNLISH